MRYFLVAVLFVVTICTTISTERSYVGVNQDNESLVGKRGIAQTVLRMSGKIAVEGTIYDAMSEGSFIEKGKEF